MSTSEDMRFRCLELANRNLAYAPDGGTDAIIAAAEKFHAFVSSRASPTLTFSNCLFSDKPPDKADSYLFGPRAGKNRIIIERAAKIKRGKKLGKALGKA